MNRAQKARRESGFRSMVSRYAPRRTYYEFTVPFFAGQTGKDYYGTEYHRESSGQIRRTGNKMPRVSRASGGHQVPTDVRERILQGEGNQQL